MTDEQLDSIERALGLRLPEAYRRLSREFPFRPVGSDGVYWLSDDPAEVIESTRYPLEDGGYDGAGWRTSFLVIGRSPAGDLYLLDMARDDSPVFTLSHEDHSILEEWPGLEAFAQEYREWPERWGAEQAARREAERERGRNRRLMLVLLFATIPVALAALAGVAAANELGWPEWTRWVSLALGALGVGVLIRGVALVARRGVHY